MTRHDCGWDVIEFEGMAYSSFEELTIYGEQVERERLPSQSFGNAQMHGTLMAEAYSNRPPELDDNGDEVTIYEDATTDFVIDEVEEEEESSTREGLAVDFPNYIVSSPIENDFLARFPPDDGDDDQSMYDDSLTQLIVALPVEGVEEEEDEGGIVVWTAASDYPNCGMVAATMEAIEGLEKGASGDEDCTCSICLEEVPCGSSITRMPCCHGFHEECIVRWLRTSNCCPMCRHRLPH